MKNWIKHFVIVSVIFILSIVITLVWKISNDNFNNLTIQNKNKFELSPTVCEYMLGVSPEIFVKEKGKDTILENSYTYANIGKDGVLLLILSDTELNNWKNSRLDLQVLQKIMP